MLSSKGRRWGDVLSPTPCSCYPVQASGTISVLWAFFFYQCTSVEYNDNNNNDNDNNLRLSESLAIYVNSTCWMLRVTYIELLCRCSQPRPSMAAQETKFSEACSVHSSGELSTGGDFISPRAPLHVLTFAWWGIFRDGQTQQHEKA